VSRVPEAISTPVLIVGAGPVGMATALDLGWRGIGCLAIDMQADMEEGINVHPRAAAITPRTMEFCRRWGLADKVRHSGFPRDYTPNVVYCTTLAGPALFTQQFESAASRPPLMQTPETRERCPQIWFDPILRNALDDYPHVMVRRPWKLESFRQDALGVTASITNLATREPVEVRCQYMVACDGPLSPVREVLGISSSGNGLLSYSLNAVIDVPDFLSHHDKGQAERYLFIDGTGTWANLTVIDGRDRLRFTLTGSEAKLDRQLVDMPMAIRKAFGAEITFNIIAVSAWRRREAVATQFRIGRVFLAGDAAHTIPPNLGLGMNTGVQDAVDLGWKLDAVLTGWGGSKLLDSYEPERRPVATAIASASTQAYRHWMGSSDEAEHFLEDSEAGRAARANAARRLREALPNGWDTLGLQMGYCYDGSPICVADDSLASSRSDSIDDEDANYGTYVQTARPGARAPHAWLSPGRSTIDLFGRGFVLLCFADAPRADAMAQYAAQRKIPLSIERIENADVHALYGADYVLVRPDGHVARRGNYPEVNAASVLDCVSGH
jgi:2-polyprenyl-6-methoxyphenol hydroxylase-like FAD-dependent oxidoreductase